MRPPKAWMRLVVGTGWPEFRTLDFSKIKHLLKRPVIVDTKNLLDSSKLQGDGLSVHGRGADLAFLRS